MLVKKVTRCDNAHAFCPTHPGCKVIRKEMEKQKCIKCCDVSTFHSYFSVQKDDDFDYKNMDELAGKLKNKTVFIDEYSMMSYGCFKVIYYVFIKYGRTVYLYGDSNQCDPVEETVYDNIKSPAVRQMCAEVVTLHYNPATSRLTKRHTKCHHSFSKLEQ